MITFEFRGLAGWQVPAAPGFKGNKSQSKTHTEARSTLPPGCWSVRRREEMAAARKQEYKKNKDSWSIQNPGIVILSRHVLTI